MSVHVGEIERNSTHNYNQYNISPLSYRNFSDWNGGKAVAGHPENRRDDVLLERPTMEMGNRTKIGDEESPYSPPEHSYRKLGMDLIERFNRHNQDNHPEYRVDDTTSKDVDQEFNRHTIAAFTSELELNRVQKQRAFKRLMRLDIPRATGRTELNAFLICVVVTKRDDRIDNGLLYHPQQPEENKDDRFRRLEKTLCERFTSITPSKLTKVYNKLTQGNPPTRSSKKWEEFVNRRSFDGNSESDETATFDLEQQEKQIEVN